MYKQAAKNFNSKAWSSTHMWDDREPRKKPRCTRYNPNCSKYRSGKCKIGGC